jgi:Fe-S cluster biogenesis protein NfuA
MNNKLNLIKLALDTIKPYLQNDGGDIEFVELTNDNILKIKLIDSCLNCEFKQQTLLAIEKQVKKFYPDLKSLLEV